MRAARSPFVVRLVRGEARGVGPSVLRACLTPLSWLFVGAVEVRNILYQGGVFTRHRVPCPVISVGNLTVGGTGKTPLVEWFVREIRLMGFIPAVLSRGYGARADETPDELAALAENLADLKYVRDPDRVRGALTAIEKHMADVVVLDDGYQHHRLARDLDVVAVDASAPYGGGYCLPRGMLREPVRSLRRAGVVVITRSDQVGAENLEDLLRSVRKYARGATVAMAVHRPRDLVPVGGGTPMNLDWLRGRRVFSVAGIAHPEAFERTLVTLGAEIAGNARYPDHHRYRDTDFEEVAGAAREVGAEGIVTTQKDAVKWNGAAAATLDARVLGVGIEFTSGGEEVRARLRQVLKGSAEPV